MSIDSMFKQANAAMQAGAWADAERRYRALTRLKPDWAWHNLAVLQSTLGRNAEAETSFRAALQANPTSAEANYGLAMLLLNEGRFAEGWPLFEARRGVPGLAIPAPRLAYPEWRGEDLAGKRLLVVFEQGLGDQIQFARFVRQLAERGAQVVLLCDPSLAELFQQLGVEVVPAIHGATYPVADYWVLLGSLPLRLGLTAAGISGAPYLTATPRGSGGVGVKTKGSATHVQDRHRSMGAKAAGELAALGRSLDPEATGAASFKDTAEIIMGLDLVISVDTSVVHLAGALGKPVWILLSAAGADWRWLRGRNDSPWYDSARIYRQERPGDWAGVLSRVRRDLAAAGLAPA